MAEQDGEFLVSKAGLPPGVRDPVPEAVEVEATAALETDLFQETVVGPAEARGDLSAA